MSSQLGAILWAQWKALSNFRPAEGRTGRLAGILMALVWYGMWTGLAIGAWFATEALDRDNLRAGVPWGLMAVFCYWQLAPIMSASVGATIDIRKLLLYPIPTGSLFVMEVVLRAVAGLEMLLVLTGGSIGLLRNPAVPLWGPLVAMPLFVAFNLLTAAGLRNLLERLLAYKRVREALIFLVVLAAALPQVIAYSGLPRGARRFLAQGTQFALPWTAAGHLALGERVPLYLALLAAWTALAWLFGTHQFRRSLSFDFAARSAADRHTDPARSWAEALYRIPGLLLPDPLAAVVEKELRSLCRTPRFRLLFLMGFSFGVLIWWPLFRRGSEHGQVGDHYPVLISVYALVLLAEALIWNVFGFDRAAAQIYFSAPVPFSKVLEGKNLAAAIFIVLEVALVMLVCSLLRLPMSGLKILEAYLVTLVLCVYLAAAGNLSSLYYPRSVNPDHSWGRASRGKLALFLMLTFPVLGIPVLLAYAARYAFASEAAFYGVLAFAAAAGAVFYGVALDTAVNAAERRKERLLAALAESPGPLIAE